MSAGGSRSEPATVGTGAEQNWGATGLAADGSRSEPATLGRTEKGWELVGVADSDVVACQGFLPERHVGVDADTRDRDAGAEEGGGHDGDAGVESDAQHGGVRVAGEGPCEVTAAVGGGVPVRLPSAAEGDASATRGAEFLTNEPKLDQDVIATQSDDIVDVVANSDDFSGLDKLRTNPSMRGTLSSEAVQILWSRVPAHPLRRRLRSIWPISDLAAYDWFCNPQHIL